MNPSVAIAITLFSRIMRDKIQKPTTVAELLEMYPQLTAKFTGYTIKGVGSSLSALIRTQTLSTGSIAVVKGGAYHKYQAVGV